VSQFQPWLDRGFVPYAFGAADNLRRVNLRPFGLSVRAIEADTASSEPFHRAMSRLNHHAFGAMAMPRWVQWDLAVTPSLFVGFAAPWDELPLPWRDPDARKLGLVPVSEALAVPTAVEGRWASVSLASAVRGLGFLTKLLNLAVLGPDEAVGVTQADNPAVRTHLRFGALTLRQVDLPFHDASSRSFAYALRPTAHDLARLAEGGTVTLPHATTTLPHAADRAPWRARLQAGEVLQVVGQTADALLIREA
jgi:hypothetical protein